MEVAKTIILLAFLYNSQHINGNAISTNNEKIAPRIIGGEPARVGQFRFAAAINVQTSTSTFFCAGALLTNEFILTAGHCVKDAVLFTIQLGSLTLTGEDPNRVTVATSEYFLHPDFDPTTLANDVGMIKLRMPVEFTNYIDSIHYLPTTPVKNSTNLQAIGWGQLDDENPDLSDHLNYVEVTSISNDECKITYGNQITDEMVCVAGNYNEGTCLGDSGGPLIHIVSRGQQVHVGISSFTSANGCNTIDPSGYTRIYPYLEWIKNITLEE